MNRIHLTVVLAACAGLGHKAVAIDTVASIGVNYKNIDMAFAQDVRVSPASGSNALLDGRVQQHISFDAWQPFVQGSVAAVHGDYYVAVNGETDVYDEGSDVKVRAQRSPGIAINAPSYSAEMDVERHDLGLTLGWRGIERVALFIGFKYGKTEFDDGGTARQFTASGPLLGASYSLVTDGGVLTLGGAFARMRGRYDEDASGRLFADEISGDANGFSAFINWSAPLGERLRYLVELRWQRYDFDGSDSLICHGCDNGLVVPPEPARLDKDFSVRETLYGIGASLLYAL